MRANLSVHFLRCLTESQKKCHGFMTVRHCKSTYHIHTRSPWIAVSLIHLSFFPFRLSCFVEKESEARAKLEALKIQMQLIAEYGRRLIETGVSFFFFLFSCLYKTRKVTPNFNVCCSETIMANNNMQFHHRMHTITTGYSMDCFIAIDPKSSQHCIFHICLLA